MHNDFEIRGRRLGPGKALVMGILNLTPDSFYDGGKLDDETALLEQASRFLREGAAILDLGAVSTRPGAADVSEAEELQRLLGPLKLIRREFPEALISIDTWRSRVAEACAAEGADIINDISGGMLDPNMFATVARLQLPYVLMHMQGNPQTMQLDPQYTDVVAEVLDFFKTQCETLESLGFRRIILDPGFGFGKTPEHNFKLLKALPELAFHGYPILAGVSRKSMINRVLGTKPESALNGTTVANTLALLNGAAILRVHDVKEAMQAVKLVEFYTKC